MKERILAPSMLSADFGHLADDTKMIDRSAAQWIHIDVMDGVFVPNISFGFPVLKAIKAASDKFCDVHLMIVEPEKYVERFAKAGAHLVTFHIDLIRQSGALVGVSIKPGTPVEILDEWLDKIDLVLVMSVEPGFGGQSFMPNSVDKVKYLRNAIDSRGLNVTIEIDGGVSAANAGMLYEAGCDALVAGSAVFGAPDPEAEIIKILNA